MNIMKRRNKSVQHARATPSQVVGGGQSVMTKAIAEAAYANGSISIAQGQDSMMDSSKTTTRRIDHHLEPFIDRKPVRDHSELNEAQQIREASLNEMQNQIGAFEADSKERAIIADSGINANLDRSIDTMFENRTSKREGNTGLGSAQK